MTVGNMCSGDQTDFQGQVKLLPGLVAFEEGTLFDFRVTAQRHDHLD